MSAVGWIWGRSLWEEGLPRDETSWQRLAGAVTLAHRFYQTAAAHHHPSKGLALAEDGSLCFTLGDKLLAIRLQVGGLLAPRRGFVALTWDRAFYFRHSQGTPPASTTPSAWNSLFSHETDGRQRGSASMAALLIHELVHVEQQHKALLGLTAFLIGYVLGWARGGFRYQTNPYEVAALRRQEEARDFFASLPGGETQL